MIEVSKLPVQTKVSKKKKLWERTKDLRIGLLFLAPSILLFSIFLFYPLFRTIYYSFYLTDIHGEANLFVGLENYQYLFSDPAFYKSIKSTLLFVLYTVPTSIIFALFLALIANGKVRGIGLMVLNKGSIQQVGTPLNIYNEPANEFVASFIGSPSMNINDGEVNKEKGVLHIGQLQIPLSIRQLKQLPEGTIRIGMRPEHIALSEEGQEVTLQSVEVLGNESILNFAVNGTTWSAKVIGQLLLNKGDKVKLLFSQEKLCFFNENTNERLKVVAEEELKVVAK
ncbi:hypothetical protein [Bacillus cereus]|uniref:hypothetical protein n=1 Tax=Bacillus cereus TaxID=1396 RepID=UPI0025B63B3C|nr:hypothetical protein [Bacillus cereus]MDN4101061.1 hypothetical protein [Bacillus cereus]